jgi:hypothetical protein
VINFDKSAMVSYGECQSKILNYPVLIMILNVSGREIFVFRFYKKKKKFMLVKEIFPLSILFFDTNYDKIRTFCFDLYIKNVVLFTKKKLP